MKKSVSSILFALSIFGGVAHADTVYSEVSATFTYDKALLASECQAHLSSSICKCGEIWRLSAGFLPAPLSRQMKGQLVPHLPK